MGICLPLTARSYKLRVKTSPTTFEVPTASTRGKKIFTLYEVSIVIVRIEYVILVYPANIAAIAKAKYVTLKFSIWASSIHPHYKMTLTYISPIAVPTIIPGRNSPLGKLMP